MTGWLLIVVISITPGHSVKSELWLETGPACERAAAEVRKYHRASLTSAHRAVAICLPVSGGLPEYQPQGDQ